MGRMPSRSTYPPGVVCTAWGPANDQNTDVVLFGRVPNGLRLFKESQDGMVSKNCWHTGSLSFPDVCGQAVALTAVCVADGIGMRTEFLAFARFAEYTADSSAM